MAAESKYPVLGGPHGHEIAEAGVSLTSPMHNRPGRFKKSRLATKEFASLANDKQSEWDQSCRKSR